MDAPEPDSAADGSAPDDASSDENAGGAAGASGITGAGAGGSGGALIGGGATAPAIDAGPRADASDDPPVELHELPGGEPSCAQWEGSLAAVNERDYARHQLFMAEAIIEGTLGALEEIVGRPYAHVHVTRVHHGLSFIGGSDVLVSIEPALHASLGEGTDVVLGVGRQPLVDIEHTAGRVTWSSSTAIRASDVAAYEPLVDYRPWLATVGVAVMRVVGHDAGRVHLELVETLAGELPALIQENWLAEWELPLPSVSSDQYIVSFDYLTESFGALGRITDFRPSTAAERARVEAALAHMDDETSTERRYLAQIDDHARTAETVKTAWMYHQAELVARVQISGITPKCCATINNYFFQNDVIEAFTTTATATATERVITLGEYTEDGCGDRFIYPFYMLPPDPPESSESYRCDGMFNTTLYPREAWHVHRLPDTSENAATVRSWVESAKPLYQLHPASTDLSTAVPAAPLASALWSAPFPAEVALGAGELTEITIESVLERSDGFEVELSAALGPDPLRLKLLFQCGDARLLEVGAGYRASLIRHDAVSVGTWQELVESGNAFLAPGFLIPIARP
jgi:hypothetical protein